MFWSVSPSNLIKNKTIITEKLHNDAELKDNCYQIVLELKFCNNLLFFFLISLSIAELFRDFLEAVHTQMDINIVYLPTWKFVFDFQMQHLLFTSLLFKTLCSNQIVNKTKFKSMGLENNGENIFDAETFFDNDNLLMIVFWKEKYFFGFLLLRTRQFSFSQVFFPIHRKWAMMS